MASTTATPATAAPAPAAAAAPLAAPSTGHALLASSIGLSILYGINMHTEPSFFRVGLKAGSIALLAVYAATQGKSRQLTAALLLSALGDAFLAWPGEVAFFRGLTSFLVAHLFYIALFTSTGNGSPYILNNKPRLRLAIAVLLLAPIVTFKVLPRVAESLQVPIAMYSAVVLIMVLGAATMTNGQVALGALLFAISDSLLASDEFLIHRRARHRWLLQHLVWATYYVGQLFIATGLVDGRNCAQRFL